MRCWFLRCFTALLALSGGLSMSSPASAQRSFYQSPEALLALPAALRWIESGGVTNVRDTIPLITRQSYYPIVRSYDLEGRAFGRPYPGLVITVAELKRLGCEGKAIGVALDLQRNLPNGQIDFRTIYYLPFNNCVLDGPALVVRGNYDRLTGVTMQWVKSATPGISRAQSLEAFVNPAFPVFSYYPSDPRDENSAMRRRGGKLEYRISASPYGPEVGLSAYGNEVNEAFANIGTSWVDPAGGIFTPSATPGEGVYKFSEAYLRSMRSEIKSGTLTGLFNYGCTGNFYEGNLRCRLRVMPYTPIVYDFRLQSGSQSRGGYLHNTQWFPSELPGPESTWPAHDTNKGCSAPFATPWGYNAVFHCGGNGQPWGFRGNSGASAVSPFSGSATQTFVSSDGKAGTLRVLYKRGGEFTLVTYSGSEWQDDNTPRGEASRETLTILGGSITSRLVYKGAFKGLTPNGMGQCDDGSGFVACEMLDGEKVESIN